MKMLRVAVVGAFVVASASLGAQPLTVRGEIVEVSCYTKLGIEKSTGAGHVACAKECVAKGQALAILTDGDGLLKITGDFAADKYAKLTPFIGRQVEVSRHARSIPRLLARHQSDEARASGKEIRLPKP